MLWLGTQMYIHVFAMYGWCLDCLFEMPLQVLDTRTSSQQSRGETPPGYRRFHQKQADINLY